MNSNIFLMPEATSAVQGHPGPTSAAPESLSGPLYSGDPRNAMEVTDQPGSFLPARFSPGLVKAKPVALGRVGRSPDLGLLFQVASGTAGWGYMHMGTEVPASPLAPRLSTGSRSRWRGWMSPLGAWQGKREQGHLSSTSPLNSGASPSTWHRHPRSPGRLGLPAPGPCHQGCSVWAPSPRPGSAGRSVATSVCLRDGLQRGLQPRGLRRG